MIKVERTTKTDLKAKGMYIYDNKIVDDEGDVVDIVALLSNTYGDTPFDLSVTRSVKEDVSQDGSQNFEE